MGLFTKVFGTYSQRELKSIYPIVDKITALEDEYKQLTDAELQAKTPEFKERLANGETLDDILPEAFAAVREAADRVLGMRPYPVQLVGGIVLHQGRIAEMKTGEGKTVSIRRTDAKLPKGQYFDAELEGCTVLDDATGEELGKLDKVLHYPAHKVYQVRGGAHEYLIPAVPEVFIASADPDAGIIRVHMMKGLATDEN